MGFVRDRVGKGRCEGRGHLAGGPVVLEGAAEGGDPHAEVPPVRGVELKLPVRLPDGPTADGPTGQRQNSRVSGENLFLASQRRAGTGSDRASIGQLFSVSI